VALDHVAWFVPNQARPSRSPIDAPLLDRVVAITGRTP
jgi:hypothetical protein